MNEKESHNAEYYLGFSITCLLLIVSISIRIYSYNEIAIFDLFILIPLILLILFSINRFINLKKK